MTAFCLKSDLRHTPANQHPVMSDITVRDCVVASTCNATKIGTETVGDIENVLFEHITVRKHSDTAGKNPIPSGVCIAAISLQSNDGAKVRNITCRDYTIEDCYAPVFVQLQHRTSHRPCSLGSLGDITIERIVCKRSLAASQINVCQDGPHRCGDAGRFRRAHPGAHGERARIAQAPDRALP